MPKLPWYSFLYRLFGAHGTFWLWLVVALTLWWTAKPAWVHLANQTPAEVTVAEAARAGPRTRWVSVRGVGISLDQRLLDRREPSPPPVDLLVDPQDPAAERWVRLHALSQPSPAAIGAQGGMLGAFPTRVLLRPITSELQRTYTDLRAAPELFLPTPERSLVLLGDHAPALTAPLPPPVESTLDPIEAYEARFAEWTALVRERIRPGLELHGVLDPAPAVVLQRLRQDLDLVPARYLLRPDRRPEEVEAYVFAGALAVLLFLAAGLYGTGAARADDATAAAEGEAEEEPAPNAEPVAAGEVPRADEPAP